MATIDIEFRLSKSHSGEQVLYEVAGLTFVNQKREDKITNFHLRLAKNKIRHAFGLLKSLKRLKHKRIFVDGKETEYDTAFGFLRCYKERLQLGSPPLYCFGNFDTFSQHNIFGCVHSSFFEFGANKYGKWNQRRNEWRFDKKAIRKALKKELLNYRCCPAFNEQRIDKIIQAIPATVNPLKDPDWDFMNRGFMLDDKRGTQLVEISHPNSIELLFVDGVRIVGERAIEKIAKKAGLSLFTKGLEWIGISVNLLEEVK